MADFIETISTAVSNPLGGETSKKDIDAASILAAEASKRSGGFRIVSFDDLPLSPANATANRLYNFMPEKSMLIHRLSNETIPVCPLKYGVLIVIKTAHYTGVAMPFMFFHEPDETFFASYTPYLNIDPNWQRVNAGLYNGKKFTANTDLNNVTTSGFYYCDEGNIANTISNRPSTANLFVVEVRNGPGKASASATNTRRQQIFTDYANGDVYTRFNVSYNSYSWGAWKKFTTT